MKCMQLALVVMTATTLALLPACGDDGTSEATGDETGADVVIPDSECQYHAQCVQELGDLAPCEQARCVDGQCVAEIKPTYAECDDPGLALGECERGVCNESGTCTATSADDGTSCKQAQWTSCAGFQCMGGSCVGYEPDDCDDGNPCTDDGCDPAQGCTHTDNTDPCNDLNPCTGDDVCGDGVCMGATDLCQCSNNNDCVAYDDGDKCNGKWGCVDQICQPLEGSEVTCSGGDDVGQCELYGCNPANGKCEVQDAEDYIECDDGNICSGCVPGETCPQFDFCQNGVCKPGKNNACGCDADAECALFGPQDGSCEGLWTCMGGTCTEGNAANGTPCDDADPCTAGDICVAGACIPGLGDGCVDPTLYELLGEAAGIETVIVDFVGRVVGDNKINGYFLNSSVDGGKLVTCLVKQVSAATGSTTHSYPGPGDPADEDGCRNMVAAHAGMGVSTHDFNDLVAHLVDALVDAGVAQDHIDTITGVLAPMAADIVEDVDSDDTVYQRVGRKPAIETVVGGLLTDVLADASLVGFFGATDAARLDLCLVRQVCGIDGPCIYGAGVEDALKIADDVVPCRDMASTHAGLTDSSDASPITLDDFNALVTHLVGQLDAAGVAEADKDAILGALGGLCDDIVAGGCGPAPPATLWADVAPIFAGKCGPCHTTSASGGHSIGDAYAESQKTAAIHCSDTSVGECAITVIQSGVMPKGAGCTGDPATDVDNAACLTQQEQDTIQAWIDGGMLETAD